MNFILEEFKELWREREILPSWFARTLCVMWAIVNLGLVVYLVLIAFWLVGL